MTNAEKNVWVSFKEEIIDKFLRNSKDENYESIVQNMFITLSSSRL